MLALRRVTFRFADVIDFPTASAIPDKPAVDAFVRVAIAIEHRRGTGTRCQPTGNPVQMGLLVAYQGFQRPTHGFRESWFGEIVGELPVYALLKDVRQGKRFRRAPRQSDLVAIEALIAAPNPHGGQTNLHDRSFPQPRMPRFVSTVFGELLDQVRVSRQPNEAAKQQRAIELTLAVPVQPPFEVTPVVHDFLPSGTRTEADRSAV